MTEYHKDAWYRRRSRPDYHRTLDSWGEKNVKLGMGPKMPAQLKMTRQEFEQDWELIDPRPWHEIPCEPMPINEDGSITLYLTQLNP